jgi:hypothetical protein
MSKAAELAALIGSGQAQGDKNLIINGGMTVDQRSSGSAQTGISDTSKFGVDRFQVRVDGSGSGRLTSQQVTDAPTGFKNSLKLTVTTADASPTSAEGYAIRQAIEGQNIYSLGLGTADAKTMTVSFWVKSSLTGNFSLNVGNGDNTRVYGNLYAISSANTWEYKTVTLAGDTSGTWVTTNAAGLTVVFGLGGGSDRVVSANAWGTQSGNTKTFTTGATNVAGTVNATWQITGLQMEIGDVATPFEHESYATTLQKCQRYYNRLGFMKHQFYSSSVGSSNPDLIDSITFSPMRDAPDANPYTDANYSSSGSSNTTSTTLTLANIGISSLTSSAQRSSSGAANVRTTYYLELVSEL